MTTLSLPPFLDLGSLPETPDTPAEVEGTPWAWGASGAEPLGPFIKGWDYGVSLQFVRRVSLDTARIASVCGLSRDAMLRVVVTWSTSGGLSAGEAVYRQDVPLGAAARIELDVQAPVPSSRLAGDVTLTTMVLLARQGKGDQPMAARHPGSILWRDEQSVLLEGKGSRLPIVIVDFSERFLDGESDAGWTVQFASEWLYRHSSVGMQILINSRHAEIAAAIRGAGRGKEERAIRSALLHDVGRILVNAALDEEEFRKAEEYPDGTLGRAMQLRLQALFPGRATEDLYQWRQSEPAAFERALQAHHRLFKP